DAIQNVHEPAFHRRLQDVQPRGVPFRNGEGLDRRGGAAGLGHDRRIHSAWIGVVMTARTSRQAVVFAGSGCGSVDAYGVGVLKALVEMGAAGGEALEPSIYSGSAFGAFNAALMVADAGGDTAATVKYLEGAWLDGLCSTASKPNGVF